MTEKTPRQVLSENLRSLMDARSELGTIKKVASASGSALSNGKVGRIYAASHTTDIDTLQALANVFDLQPWQLLVEGLKPSALPRLADAQMLSQILDAVQRRQTAPTRKGDSQAAAHQLERDVRPEEDALSRAIQQAEGKQQRAKRSSSGGVQKPGTRRRVQGTPASRRKG